MRGLVLILVLALSSCARNVPYVKAHAQEAANDLGYQIIGYEGYEWSPFCGGDVWYSAKREDSPGIIYSFYFCKWGDELHFYGPRIVSGSQIQVNQN